MAVQNGDNLMGLIGATPISDTQSPKNDYSGGLGDYDVFSAVEEEKKYVDDSVKNKLIDHLKNRSTLRKALRTGEKSTGDKDIDNKMANSSEFVDGMTQVLVGLGKSPEDVSKYMTSEGNKELIDKAKTLQNGKFSGDIQDYIDGKYNKGLSGLLTDMFPEYMSNQGTSEPQATEQPQTTEQYDSLRPNQTVWEKISAKQENFSRNVAKKFPGLSNFLFGAYKEVSETATGLIDIINKAINKTPEEFGEYVRGEDGRKAYEKIKANSEWDGTFEDYVKIMESEFNKEYTKLTTYQERAKEKFEQQTKGIYNPLSAQGNLGELGGELAELYTVDKLIPGAGKLKGTSPFLGGSLIGVEMQGLDDIQKEKVSSLGQYGLSAIFGGIVNKGISLVGKAFGKITEAPDIVQNSASRLSRKTIQDIGEEAFNASQDAMNIHPMTRIAREESKKIAESIAEQEKVLVDEMSALREKMKGNFAVQGKDILDMLNKALEKHRMGGRLEVDGGLLKWKGGSVVKGGTEGLDEVIQTINGAASEYNITKSAENASMEFVEEVIRKIKQVIKKDTTSSETRDVLKTMLGGGSSKSSTTALSDGSKTDLGLYDMFIKGLGEKDGAAYISNMENQHTLLTMRDLLDNLGQGKLVFDNKGLFKDSTGKLWTPQEISKWLQDNGFMSESLIDKQVVAKASQDFYNVSLTPEDSLLYPSLPGAYEKGIETTTKAIRTAPMSKKILGKKVGGYAKYSKVDESAARNVLKKGKKLLKDVATVGAVDFINED